MGYYENVNGDLELRAGSTLYADAPIGAIEAYGGTSAPSGWMICNGTAISRSTYAELFAVIGTAFGAGDGSTTFNIPDMRESVPKGAGLTGHTVGAHLDADGLAVGEFIDDRLQTHNHSAPNSANFFITGNAATMGSGTAVQYNGSNVTTNNSGRSGATTEVKSVGVNYIIKAKQTALPKDLEAQVDAKISADANLGYKFKEFTLDVDAVGSYTIPYGNLNNVFIRDAWCEAKNHPYTVPIAWNTEITAFLETTSKVISTTLTTANYVGKFHFIIGYTD